MPKYLLTWAEEVINYYHTPPIEADSADEAWELFDSSLRSFGTDYDLTDYIVTDVFDCKAEEVE